MKVINSLLRIISFIISFILSYQLFYFLVSAIYNQGHHFNLVELLFPNWVEKYNKRTELENKVNNHIQMSRKYFKDFVIR